MENVTAEEKTAVPMTMTVQEYIPMLLMNTAFEPGTCMEFIDSLTDPDVKKMALFQWTAREGGRICQPISEP